jgi:uncharacterized membrane protein YedE/YeeE
LLLSLPFTVRFALLNADHRGLSLASLPCRRSPWCCSSARSPITGRLPPRVKEPLVRYSNLIAVLRLAAVGAAVLTAVMLVTRYAAGTLPGALITAITGCVLASLWFALPLGRHTLRP